MVEPDGRSFIGFLRLASRLCYSFIYINVFSSSLKMCYNLVSSDMDISQISRVSEEPLGLATGECRIFIDSVLILSRHMQICCCWKWARAGSRLSVLLQYLWYYIIFFLFPCASLSPAQNFSSSWRCCDVLHPYSHCMQTEVSSGHASYYRYVSLYEWDSTSKIGNVYHYRCCLTINITLPSSTLTKIHSWQTFCESFVHSVHINVFM